MLFLNITSVEYLIPVITGTILFGLLFTFVIYFILLYRKTQFKLDWERERLKQELFRAESEIKEQTLTNVSRELHDNFGQIASLIKINLNMISKDLSKSDQEKVTESLSLIRQLIGDIKALSSSLNGEKIRKNGWLSTLSDDTQRINKIGDLHIEFYAVENVPLAHEKEVILYRIIQEILNNCLKHSQANKAYLEIRSTAQSLSITYRDNGIGFDPDAVILGAGITNMQERCKMIGANFEIDSHLGRGVQIKIHLNQEANHDNQN